MNQTRREFHVHVRKKEKGVRYLRERERVGETQNVCKIIKMCQRERETETMRVYMMTNEILEFKERKRERERISAEKCV